MHPQSFMGGRVFGRVLLRHSKRLQRLLGVVLLIAAQIGFAEIVITGGWIVAAQVVVFHHQNDALEPVLADILAQGLEADRLYGPVIFLRARAAATLVPGGPSLECLGT